jgi:hypothetical protein
MCPEVFGVAYQTKFSLMSFQMVENELCILTGTSYKYFSELEQRHILGKLSISQFCCSAING